ncbi:hypothetical protein GOP47_0004802 [Adiantum capillus-veneris]|uniref:Uncharacterized protein n=1 Tax=Adiantum capillus-veneris TaxID=13818 RepID=A0A9D4V4Y5_ADICA|nr:hypothetical protein GOP47_0004802 [Adiantum capillus-veneris]
MTVNPFVACSSVKAAIALVRAMVVQKSEAKKEHEIMIRHALFFVPSLGRCGGLQHLEQDALVESDLGRRGTSAHPICVQHPRPPVL